MRMHIVSVDLCMAMPAQADIQQGGWGHKADAQRGLEGAAWALPSWRNLCWFKRFDWNCLHILSVSMGQVQVRPHHPTPGAATVFLHHFEQNQYQGKGLGCFAHPEKSEILHPTAAFPKLEEMKLPAVTEEVAGLWENLSSFGEIVSSLEFTEQHCQRVQFPWLGRSMLRGQISLGSELWACSSCILESGRHWCGATVEKPPSWPGSLQGISSPFSAAFSPCLIPLSTMEVQSPRLRHAPPPPLAKRFPPASPWAGAGTGQEGPHSPRTGTCKACGPVPSCCREDTAMGTYHLSPSKLLCCQWLPEATSLAQVFLTLL
ncbi:hypothetical protein IHE44_0002587 [Lamprotornis superbus]|uniref:Uncharacterized protein n=1 Tax=Lamprotornis superbus TaxID=245042 RepID=A0A835TS55_9PASS|nr:hypothetical protein IHE44_0002587 [Lamprotornis superbus]